MSPIQQMLLGVGAVATKTYVDDVFSTFLYEGNDSTSPPVNQIQNGIDLASEGGLVWMKCRSQSSCNHMLVDTVRGTNKALKGNTDYAQNTDPSINSFNNNGFTINSIYSDFNDNGQDYASWTFRKAPGSFTCLTYTGNNDGSNANRTISHDLGSIPGCIIVKRTDASNSNWHVYHRNNYSSTFSNPAGQWLQLDKTDKTYVSNNAWGGVQPTSTNFTIGWSLNNSGGEFVAYVFAGGESSASESVSVNFDGSGDYLTWGATSDFAFGTGAYTVEFWVKPDTISGNKTFFNVASSGGFAVVISSSKVAINGYSVGDKVATSTGPVLSQWTHYALVREGTGSNQTKIYKNGVLEKTGTDSTDWTTTATTGLGANASNGNKAWDGEISNFRVVKGTAVYTSSFRPPTEPLTNITNTVLLCCNDAPTSATVTPGTITSVGTPTTSTDSPFDDPSGFVFGESGSENVIKCGSYVASGSAGLEINLGWEPQWLMVKKTSNTSNWLMVDNMRGWAGESTDARFIANGSNEEYAGARLQISSTGFICNTTDDDVNWPSGESYIFLALRRPDGYVGKPVELGTSVFNTVMGTSNSDVPAFVSGFVTDFAFNRSPTATEDWWTQSRLTGDKYLRANTTGSQGTSTPNKWDYNNGWYAATSNQSAYQSWMWKRHAGFDVVAYEGNANANRVLSHSLNAVPQMIWYKRRDATDYWGVGVNFTNSDFRFLQLNSDSSGSTISYTARFKSKPTSSSFEIGQDSNINGTGGDYIAMLFASTDVSAVGSYTGDGTNNGSHEITCGFTPRFILIKCVTSGVNFSHWRVWDSLNGLDGSGIEKYLKLNSDGAEVDGYDYIDTTATGFKFNTNFGPVNGNGNEMIYYAHA